MNIREHVPLAPFTTFRIGGPARFFIEAETDAEILQAIAFARQKKLWLLPLGSGSNILVPDTGLEAVVLKMPGSEILFELEGDEVFLVAGAGTSWEEVVDAAAARGLWGIENLAGIPGTLGGALVQNIGAYGIEFSRVFAWADGIDITGKKFRLEKENMEFGYRDSIFKYDRSLIITRVALRLSSVPEPHLAYADLKRASEAGEMLTTPAEIARVVRRIRFGKFPDLSQEGSAGSFFKNPIISEEVSRGLSAAYPELPQFPQQGGGIKIPLAWILDRVLGLRGFAIGPVRLYEKQPLVIVAERGSTAHEVNLLAEEVVWRVFAETGIQIEREVETFASR